MRRLVGVSCAARRMLRNSTIQRLALGERALGLLVGLDLRLERVDAAAEVVERADHRLDPLRAQTQFFDQLDRAAAAAAQALPGVAALAILYDLLVAIR